MELLIFLISIISLISTFKLYCYIPPGQVESHTRQGEMSAKSAAEKTAAIEARMSSASPGDPRTHLKQLEKCDRKCRSLGATMLEARMKIGRACVCHALPCCLVVLCTVTVCVSDNTVTMLPPQDLVTLPSKQRSPRISFPRRSRNSLQLLD